MVILIGPGFDEKEMVHFLYNLRRSGKAVCLVSSSGGLVTGAYGLTVRPDYSLGQFEHDPGRMFVMVPGGAKSVTALLADPRVHRLFELAAEYDGWVAITPGAAREFVRAGFQALLTAPYFLREGFGNGEDQLDQSFGYAGDDF